MAMGSTGHADVTSSTSLAARRGSAGRAARIHAMTGFLLGSRPPAGAAALALLKESFPEASLEERLEAYETFALSLR